MKRRQVLFLLILIFLMFSDGFADSKPGGENSFRLETISVTAEKRDEDPQKLTSSITVLSDISIEDSGIDSTRDIKGYVPNLSTAHSGSRGYFSRIGIRGISNTGIGDPAVALYIDDIPYSDLYIFNMPLYDLERIEVLKGPQGTLYGKNTEAGVINIVSREPSNSLEIRTGLEVGNYNKTKFDARLNSPVIEDKLFTRLSFLMSSRDGYIENLYNGEDVGDEKTISGRGSLIYKPNDKLDLNLTLGMSELDDKGGFPMVPKDRDKYEAASGYRTGDFEAAYNYKGESSSKNLLSALKIKYDMGFFDLVSVTGVRNNDNDVTLDGDFTPVPNYVGFNRRKSMAYSQELRLLSGDDSPLKWIAGLYYGDEKVDNETGYQLDKNYADYMNYPIYTEDNISAELGNKDASVFGQGEYRFLDDQLGITAGLRYEKSKREMDRSHRFAGVETLPAINNLEKDYTQFLPKLSADYLISENIMVYTNYAKGYKAGGFSYAVDNKALAEFDPEVSNAYEIGIKSEFREIGLRFNLAGFYTEVDDYQDRVQISPMDIVQSNATKVHIYGFELETKFAVTDRISLTGVLGFTDAKYDEYIVPVFDEKRQEIGKENFRDNKVSLIPEYDLGLFFDYRNLKGFMGRLEIFNVGKAYLDRGNKEEQESYTLFNTKIGYETENWDFYLTIKNLTDKQYYLDAFEDSTSGYMGTVGNPRTIDLSFNMRF